MKAVKINDLVMHYQVDGQEDGPVLVFSNSLGTDLRVWDKLVACLPEFKCVRYDKRGHGLSEGGTPPYFMGDLVSDVAGLLDHLALRDVVFVGLSIGGLIGQGLAAERPDLLKALVLADTACKIGTEDTWAARIKDIRKGGISGLQDAIIERWFCPDFRKNKTEELALWTSMLVRTNEDGYVGCCEAISQTDLLESTSRLTLPTLAVVGRDDGATPPDLVRETANLIKGSEFHIISKAGHLPCVEQPQVLAGLLRDFLATNKLV